MICGYGLRLRDYRALGRVQPTFITRILLAMRHDYAPMFRAAQQEVRKMIREIYYFLGYGLKV